MLFITTALQHSQSVLDSVACDHVPSGGVFCLFFHSPLGQDCLILLKPSYLCWACISHMQGHVGVTVLGKESKPCFSVVSCQTLAVRTSVGCSVLHALLSEEK